MSYVDDVLKEELERLIELTDKQWVKGILNMQIKDVNYKGTPYKGINTLLLATARGLKGYDSNEWVTLKKCNELKGRIKQGEKSSRIILWMPNVQYIALEESLKKDPANEEIKERMDNTWQFTLKAYNVFNKCQTTLDYKPVEQVKIPNDKVKACEDLLEKFTDKPAIDFCSIPTAFYAPTEDKVCMPDIGEFINSEFYYGTLFHELAHSTGHSSRLKRPCGATFGTSSYAKEELIAEIASCMINAECGLTEQLENHAVYLKSWLRKAVGDKAKNIINAFNSADKAIAWIHGERI